MTAASRRRRVAVLAVHPVSTAATRLRVMQYARYFEDAGLDVTLWSFLRDRDLPRWYGRRHAGRVAVILVGLLRVSAAVRLVLRSDVVLVQREAIPFGTSWLERWAAARRPLVWDIDDAVWESFASPTAGRLARRLRANATKYRTICGAASEVWAGSEVLATWCRRHSSRVRVVPSVVPVPGERPRPGTEPIVSWIGSHSTGPFVEDLLPYLAGVDPTPQVVVVGATVRAPAGVRVEERPWSQATEDEVLAASRVGLYPIDRSHPLAEGKCGLKAVLYMAHGIPPVVTPTSTNATIVRDAVDGLYAEAPDDWRNAVSLLLADDEAWERMSVSAHERARAEYSAQVWGPRAADWLVAVASTGSR